MLKGISAYVWVGVFFSVLISSYIVASYLISIHRNMIRDWKIMRFIRASDYIEALVKSIYSSSSPLTVRSLGETAKTKEETYAICYGNITNPLDEKFWKEVKAGKRPAPRTPSVIIADAIKLLKKIYERPRFGGELTTQEKNILNRYKKYGLIKHFKFAHRNKGGIKSRYDAKNRIIFFFPHQNLEAYKMIRRVFKLSRSKRNVLKELGIPFKVKDGCFYHKKTGEKL